MAKIEIDYFEFSVLVEACWHSGTILRHSIMQKAINGWFHCLSADEQKSAYNFFKRTKGDESTEEIQKMFLARYDPDNQYIVDTDCKGITVRENAFLFNGKYHTTDAYTINEKFIVNKTKKN